MLPIFKAQIYAIVVLGGTLTLPFVHIDPVLQPYYDEFQLEIKDCPPAIKAASPKRIVEFTDDLEERTGNVGLCHRSVAFTRIEIDTKYWNKINDGMRYSLAIHEFAHCYLWSEHNNKPHHFMNPNMNNTTKKEVQDQLRQEIKDICGT